MLNKVIVDGIALLCSAATQDEIRWMYDSVKEYGVLKAGDSPSNDREEWIFSFHQIGPHPVYYEDRKFILWGSPRELRFYTEEEFEEMRTP